MADEVNGIFNKFAANTKLRGLAAHSFQDRVRI